MKIIDTQKFEMKNEKGETIELYRNFFITFFKGEANIRHITTKKPLEVGKDYNIYYSKKKEKYIVL